jgi:hypothetical protein
VKWFYLSSASYPFSYLYSKSIVNILQLGLIFWITEHGLIFSTVNVLCVMVKESRRHLNGSTFVAKITAEKQQRSSGARYMLYSSIIIM